jgi:predicted ATP-grasp superfamily ATP-dependent carboligase
MVLYADAWPEGLVHAHIQAMQGRLPDGPPRRTGVRGSRVVYAPQAGLAHTAWLVGLSYCHDLPAGRARLSRGEPVCSVSAEADDVDAVDALLRARGTAVARRLVAARPPASTQAREETLS